MRIAVKTSDLATSHSEALPALLLSSRWHRALKLMLVTLIGRLVAQTLFCPPLSVVAFTETYLSVLLGSSRQISQSQSRAKTPRSLLPAAHGGSQLPPCRGAGTRP